MPKPDGFTIDEVDSIYVAPNERYVVSLVVGYHGSETLEEGVDSPQHAASAALQLTRDEGSSDTTWHVYDRVTGEMHVFEQSDFSHLEVR